MLTKIVGHLYLKDNRFIFYFNWIKELDKKEIVYRFTRSTTKKFPHGYDSFIELPGWRVASYVAFLENEKCFLLQQKNLKKF